MVPKLTERSVLCAALCALRRKWSECGVVDGRIVLSMPPVAADLLAIYSQATFALSVHTSNG